MAVPAAYGLVLAGAFFWRQPSAMYWAPAHHCELMADLPGLVSLRKAEMSYESLYLNRNRTTEFTTETIIDNRNH